MGFNPVWNGLRVHGRNGPARAAKERHCPVVLLEHRGMIPADMTAFTGNLYLAFRRTGNFSGAVHLVERVAIHAFHARPKMNVRQEPVLFRPVYCRGQTAVSERRLEAPLEVLLEKTNVIGSHMIRIVAFQAGGGPRVSDDGVFPRSAVFAVGVRYVACRAAEAAMLSPSSRAFCMQVAPQAGPPEQIVPEIS